MNRITASIAGRPMLARVFWLVIPMIIAACNGPAGRPGY